MAGQTSLNNTAHISDRGPGPYASGASAVIALTASATLDWTHNGKTITAAAAAGMTITLPAAGGTGWRCRIVLLTTVTSNNFICQVANTTDAYNGFSLMVSDDPATVKGFIASAGSDDTVTLNGSTKGGFVGDTIDIEDVASGLFQVIVRGKQTGTEATMFSAAV